MMSDMSSCFSSHADFVTEVGRAAFALQLPLAFLTATPNLFLVASWLAASKPLIWSTC